MATTVTFWHDGASFVDMDTIEDLRERYPDKKFPDTTIIKNWDIFNLPVSDNSVDEVRADCLFEHLTFKEEKKAFHEVKRVLKPGGTFNLSVPDLEHIITGLELMSIPIKIGGVMLWLYYTVVKMVMVNIIKMGILLVN